MANQIKKVSMTSSESCKKPLRPALTPEARENQLISLAIDLAEKQLRDGTASSQVITHYLKLGSSRERLEQQNMEKNMELMDAKKEALQSSKVTEELYLNAIKAMREYSGSDSSQTDNEGDINNETH